MHRNACETLFWRDLDAQELVNSSKVSQSRFMKALKKGKGKIPWNSNIMYPKRCVLMTHILRDLKVRKNENTSIFWAGFVEQILNILHRNFEHFTQKSKLFSGLIFNF